jgi:hypothetical protein
MRYPIIFIAILLLVCSVGALPVTGAASAVSSNNVTLAAAGTTTTAWFEYGMTSGSLIWRSPNETASGAYSKRLYGSPLMGGQKFYYRICDVTGCGAESFFTLAVVTPQPQTTFGYIYRNVTDSGFDPSIVAFNAMEPYMWPASPSRSVIWGLVFLFIFAGLWMRGKDVTIPVVLGLVVGFIALNPTYGVGMPVEFIGISQGIAYASLAGIIMAIFKK